MPRKRSPSFNGELSDDDRAGSQTSGTQSVRHRSTRACDQCRRLKSKCQPSSMSGIEACLSCLSLGSTCTYAGPSHKRGPPKGYILALERRLHQVEALLGTIISSNDQRAQSLVNDLSKDQMADYIIQRVKGGPFCPEGRLRQPFWSTKEDLMSCIMAGIDENPSLTTENYAVISPDREWQYRLQNILLSSSQNSSPTSSASPSAPASSSGSSASSSHSSLPLQTDVTTPVPSSHAEYSPHQQHPRASTRGYFPMTYPIKLEHESVPGSGNVANGSNGGGGGVRMGVGGVVIHGHTHGHAEVMYPPTSMASSSPTTTMMHQQSIHTLPQHHNHYDQTPQSWMNQNTAGPYGYRRDA